MRRVGERDRYSNARWTELVDRKHRAEMWVAFGVPAVGILIDVASMLIRWLRPIQRDSPRRSTSRMTIRIHCCSSHSPRVSRARSHHSLVLSFRPARCGTDPGDE
jgi:hypothetical protein